MEVLPRCGRNGKWYEDLSRKKRQEYSSTVQEVLGDVAVQFSNWDIKLPRKVLFGFSSGYFWGEATGRTIVLGVDSKSLIGNVKALSGVLAHELSHVSDNASGLYFRYPDSPLGWLLSEGRAEYLGYELVGPDMPEFALEDINTVREVLVTLSDPRVTRKEAKKCVNDSCYRSLGAGIVRDVIEQSGASSVVDIFSQSYEFYRDNLNQKYGLRLT